MEKVAFGQALRGCEMSAGVCLMGPWRVLARSQDGAAGLRAAGPGVAAGDQGLRFAPRSLSLPCEDRAARFAPSCPGLAGAEGFPSRRAVPPRGPGCLGEPWGSRVAGRAQPCLPGHGLTVGLRPWALLVPLMPTG